MARLIDSTLIFCEFRSTSTNTGVPPSIEIHEAEAIKVLPVTITSSFFDIPMDLMPNQVPKYR